MRSVGCVVVGGGPAGLAAARTAARHGVRVLLVDENAELGGQYYRQMPAGFRALDSAARGGAALGKEAAEGRRLIDEVRALGVEVALGAVVGGSGPLLLVVAHYLLRGGAEVVAVCESSPMRGLWRFAHRLLPHLDYVQQGYRYRREIGEAGVPFLTGHVVRRALGGTEVTGA